RHADPDFLAHPPPHDSRRLPHSLVGQLPRGGGPAARGTRAPHYRLPLLRQAARRRDPGDRGGEAQGRGAERVHRRDAVLVRVEGRAGGASLGGVVPELLERVSRRRRRPDPRRRDLPYRVFVARVPLPLPRAAQGPGVSGKRLVLDERLLAALEARFKQLGRPMPALNRTQAEVPEGATVLPNPRGTAPGLWVEDARGRVAVLLPGVPREMRGLLVEE